MNVLKTFVIKDNSYRVQYVLFHDQLGKEDSKRMEDTHNFSNVTADNMESCTEINLKNGELEIIKSKIQSTKTFRSNSPGLVDFVVGLVEFILYLPFGQVKVFKEFFFEINKQEHCKTSKLLG